MPTTLPRHSPRRGADLYLSVRVRAAISIVVGMFWATLAVVLAQRWLQDLADVVGMPLALVVIAGIAWLPGYLNVQLLVALAFDRPPELVDLVDLPDLTVLVAARNEAHGLASCVGSVLGQTYPGRLQLLIVDDGSTDETATIARRIAMKFANVEVLSQRHMGKAAALNNGLGATGDWLVATVDADTVLHPDALRRAVIRMLRTQQCVAVAGAVLVRNHDASGVTALQTHDYLLSIASVKRAQALLGGTLVAQGAFSVYMASALREIDGWPDLIGEDIVMTWGLLALGGTVQFEPTAVAWTDVPETLVGFVRQRRRWARGMIEGLRTHGRTLLARPGLLRHNVSSNVLFPYLDAVVTFALIPGIVLACFGSFMIVGPITLAVLPISLAIALMMRLRQRRALAELGLVPPSHAASFWVWLVAYQLLVSPVAFSGYSAELLRRPKRW